MSRTCDDLQAWNCGVTSEEYSNELKAQETAWQHEERNFEFGNEWMNDHRRLCHHFVPVQSEQYDRRETEREWEFSECNGDLLWVDEISTKWINVQH